MPFFFKQWGGKTAKDGGRDWTATIWSQMPAPSDGARLRDRTDDVFPDPSTCLTDHKIFHLSLKGTNQPRFTVDSVAIP